MTKRQPMSQDLQEILAAMRSTNEFSHIGDLARNIAERSTQLQSLTFPDNLSQDLETLFLMVSDFLSRVCVAYVLKDVPKLNELCQADKTVDDTYAQILYTLLIEQEKQPDTKKHSTNNI